MRKIKDIFILIVQILAYIIFISYSKFLNIERKNIQNLNTLSSGSLIVANHQTKLDPFFILAQFSFLTFLRLLPIRFPVSSKEYKKYKILRILGCYDIGETKKKRMLGLYKTRQFLIDGYSVMIFPEGCLSKNDNLCELKMGVSFLGDQAKSVVFVRIKGFNSKKKRKMSFSEIIKINGNKIIDGNFLKDQFISL